ncbi:hypothetical protein AYO22_10924 [Fonsecaea multimorphosa]|nr:hypothetical protein AYO22_10924 [Fonsecaea multimorphosa]
MPIVITLTSQDDFVRTTISVMDTDTEAEDCQVLHGLQHGRRASQEDTDEEAAEVAQRSLNQSNGKPPIPSFSPRQWLTPNMIHWIVQLLSVVAFCALLLPYLRYTRSKKNIVRERCKEGAWSLYQSKLAQCDAQAATEFSFRGGAFGLNWIEYGTILLAVIAWHYAAWLSQGWIIVRICFVKTESER